jgi:hypothetical protein
MPGGVRPDRLDRCLQLDRASRFEERPMANPMPRLRRSSRRVPSEPDAALARAPGVEYRYTLTLSNPDDAHGIFRIAGEVGTVVRYLLLVQDGAAHRYRAYLGLGSAELFDLPLRLAACGVQIERGEQVTAAPPAGEMVRIDLARGADVSEGSSNHGNARGGNGTRR